MNLLLLEPEEIDSDGRASVHGGERLRHLREVLRLGTGDRLEVGCIGGQLGFGVISKLDHDRLELAVRLERPPPAAAPVTLVLALPRPPVLRRLLEAVAAFGVNRIVLLHTARVEKSYWQSRSLDPAEVRRHLVLGLAQARDTVLPEVLLRRRFRPFVEDELPGWLARGEGLVADPRGVLPCPAIARPGTVLIAGPEGGFVEFELERFERAGAGLVGLGTRALRVETAVVALLGRLLG